MAEQLTAGLEARISYVSPGRWRLCHTLRRDGREPGRMLVMPRFTATPPVTRTVVGLTARAPIEFAQIVAAYRDESLGSRTGALSAT